MRESRVLSPAISDVLFSADYGGSESAPASKKHSLRDAAASPDFATCSEGGELINIIMIVNCQEWLANTFAVNFYI